MFHSTYDILTGMSESFPSPESKKVEKQDVIEGYKKFIEQGITSPDAIDPNAPEHQAYYEYFKQQNESAKGDEEAEARVNFEQTMFYLDAGFTDTDYAEDTLLESAQQDIENVQDQYPELASEMKKKVEEYVTKLLPGVDPKDI